MKAYVYCRVSTEEQARDDNYSLDYQEQTARLRIKEKGWATYKVRKDVGSGKNSEREGYKELLQDIQNKQIDAVIVYKLDRLSRNVRDIYDFLNQIEQNHIDFISLTEGFDTTTPMGRAMLGIAAVFAQLTRETIAENTRNGLLQRARQGKYTGGAITTYGYTYSKEQGLTICPEEAVVVRRIFVLYVNQKYGASKIAKLFNLEKVPTKTGAGWSANLISRILKNPALAGKVRHKGEVFPGLHPAVIEEETFATAQMMLGERNQVHHRVLTSKFLLSGVARCARCGRLLRARYKDQKGKSYSCKGNEKVFTEKACSGLAKSAGILDKAVLDQIREYAQGSLLQDTALEEAEKLLRVELTPSQDEHDRLVLELDEINASFTGWADRLDRGIIDEGQFALQNSRLLERKKQIHGRLEELETALARQSRAQADFEVVKATLTDFDQLWAVATLEEQQALVRLLVEKLQVGRTEAVLKLRFGEEMRIPLPHRELKRDEDRAA